MGWILNLNVRADGLAARGRYVFFRDLLLSILVRMHSNERGKFALFCELDHANRGE